MKKATIELSKKEMMDLADLLADFAGQLSDDGQLGCYEETLMNKVQQIIRKASL